MEGSALAALRAEQVERQGDRETGRQGDRETGDRCQTGPISLSLILVSHLHPVSCLHVLCRSMEQLEAALACGVTSVIADFHDLAGLRRGGAGGPRRRRSDPAWPRRASTSRASPRSSNVGRPAARRRPGAEPGGPGVLPPHRLAGGGRFLAQCGQRAERPVAARPRRRAGDGRLRPERPAIARPGGGRPAGVAGSGGPSAHADVPFGVLPVLRAALAGRNQADCGRPCRRHTVRLRDRWAWSIRCWPTANAATRSSTPRPRACWR